MRPTLKWSLITATLLAAGCSGSNNQALAPATTPNSPTGIIPQTGAAAMGESVINEDLAQSALAIYHVQIDPAALQATATLKSQRQGAQTDDLYGLEIGGFLRPDSFQVTGVRGDVDHVVISYRFSHPFKAPVNLAGPATAGNRIDLGITGRVLFLVDTADAASHTFFDESGVGGGKVVANTELISNADGFFNPGALVDLNGFSANTFPYKALVDERIDPRTGQADGLPRSNSGSSLGNYDLVTGWTQSMIGTFHDNWTGMGYLHQGQSAENVITLDRAALAAGDSLSMDVAIVAKYGDPRGGANAGEKRANRLPPATPDLSKFGYRAPHGSLDVESISFGGESGGFMPNAISASTLDFQVVDWDARAIVTASADLSQDLTSASTVAAGEAGAPTLAVCIPGVLGPATQSVALTQLPDDDDTAFSGDVDVDSGRPGDALLYHESVTKTVLSGQIEGTFTGMVRAIDVEDAQGTPLETYLDGTLQPLAGLHPRPVSYQVFKVVQDDPNTAPTLTLTTPANVLSGSTTILTVSSAFDAEGDPITVSIDWDNDSIFEDTHILMAPYTTPMVFNSTVPKYNNTTLTPLNRTIPVRYTDSVIASPLTYSPAKTFSLGGNRAPIITGTPTLSDSTVISPASFTINQGTATVTDPEGDTVTLKLRHSVDATTLTGTFPFTNIGPYTNPPVTSVDFTVWALDALHPATGAGPVNGSNFPIVTGTVLLPCIPATAIINAQFTAGTQDLSDGFRTGHTFTPQVFNSDNAPGNSRFWRCTAKATMGAGFSGGCLMSGPSFSGCGNNDNDYGIQVDNSMIGPTFTLAGKTDAKLTFNSSKNGRTGTAAHYRVWVSLDDGGSWNASNIIYDTTKAVSGIVNESNVSVPLTSYCGLANLRLRIQFIDTTASTYSVASGQAAGWAVDNVQLLVCP
ncbi:MAG: hypothetical protein ABI743_02085 [bacterium]